MQEKTKSREQKNLTDQFSTLGAQYKYSRRGDKNVLHVRAALSRARAARTADPDLSRDGRARAHIRVIARAPI